LATPETNFWKQIKKHLPQFKWIRIESWATQGVPDLLGFADDGRIFTVELKVTKSKRISISPHQISYHVEHENSPCFILVLCPLEREPKKSQIMVYGARQIREISEQGTRINPLVHFPYPHDWLLIAKTLNKLLDFDGE